LETPDRIGFDRAVASLEHDRIAAVIRMKPVTMRTGLIERIAGVRKAKVSEGLQTRQEITTAG